ncbi:helix-turn-helix domain-containing protein [Acidobacteriota bacterium]
MTVGFHDIVCFVAIGLLGLFAVFLFTQKKGNRIANYILASFFLWKCLGLVDYLINHLQIENPHVYFVLIPFAYLWGPSLYFYVRSLTHRNFRFRKQDLIHLLPFVLCWTYFAWLYHLRSTPTKSAILTAVAGGILFEEILIRVTTHFLIALYMVGAVFTLRGYRKNLKDIYSSVDKKSLSWMDFILFGFIAIWLVDLAASILYLLDVPQVVLGTLALTLLLVFSFLVVLKGLRAPEIFTGIDHAPKYRHSPLTKEEKEEYLMRLQSYMESQRPHLNPSLTIDALAKRLSISPRYLSQVINETLGVNFFDFVNGYRISEAKRIFTESSSNHSNVLDVLFDSGFNTKSAFYRVFKQHTGITPTEYKRLHGN